jgi:CRP-like cAMP-binding protein
VNGELEVVRSSGAVLATLESGALTGELGILTGRPRMASLKVLSESALVINIAADDLNQLIERDSLVAASILKTVAGYI